MKKIIIILYSSLTRVHHKDGEMFRFLSQLLVICLVTGHTTSHVTTIGNVTVVELSGSYYEMGVSYGKALQSDLKRSLSILLNHYVNEKGFSYEQVVGQAELFYRRFPRRYQQFIEGYVGSANITLSDGKILHAMETLGELNGKKLPQCAFTFSPPKDTASHSSLIGRNYDFGAPCNKISQRLVVPILRGDGTEQVTALITMPGQVYCPSCISSKGIFIEMNNGMPSGGFQVNHTTQSLLIDMLIALQNSTTVNDVKDHLMKIEYPDYSLIVNMASESECYSLEFSSNASLGMKVTTPPSDEVFVSTNFYQNTSWGNEIPKPTDATTWIGVTRRDHLIHLLSSQSSQTTTTLQKDMSKTIIQGGARWMETIYQIIYDTKARELFLKPRNDPSWTFIPIGKVLDNGLQSL